jgi:hypothetical protein
MATPIGRIKKYSIYGALFYGALSVVACFVVVKGCEYFPESTFRLANESRLPKWVTLPAGLTRPDVSLTVSYYTTLWGGDAEFTLFGKDQQKIEKESGRVRCNAPFDLKNRSEGVAYGYPNYDAVTVNGVTEIIEQRKPEDILYVTDDPAIWKQYRATGCG